jgi:large subunit ribosomal protein L30
MPGRLRVTQTKSTISHIARNRATIRALGLKRIGHTVEVPDNPAIRGMVRQVRFLVSVDEVPERATASRPSEDRGDAPASHRSGDSPTQAAPPTAGAAGGDGEEKA